MKKHTLILLLFSNVFLISAQNPNGWDTAWVTSFGGPSIEIGKDIKETSDKGFIIAGNSSTFGSGNTSFYIIKTDSFGNHQWSNSIGTDQNDVVYSVDIANDGGYFFSGISNWNLQKGYDGYLVKTNSSGTVIWSKNYGGDDWDFVYNSCLMPDGGLILCGETYSDSNGGTDFYLIRTNSNGDTLWTKRMGTNGDDTFYSVEQKNNRIYAVGKIHDAANNKNTACIYKLDFNGSVLDQDFFTGNLWENTVYNDLYLTSNGGILLCGKRSSDTSQHYIIRKVDTTNFNQFFYITTNQTYYFRSIIEGNNNDVYVLGPNIGGAGGLAAQFVRFDAGFTYLQSANFGGAKDEDGFEMIRTSKGYAIVGSTTSYGNQNGSIDENVYLVVFNKEDLVNDYFLMLTQVQDPLSPIGIKENKASLSRTTVYPNPISSTYYIDFGNNNFNGQVVNYQLFDLLGKLIHEQKYYVMDANIMIDEKHLNPGIYTYKLSLNSLPISIGKISVD